MEQEHQREVFGTTNEHSGHMINGIFTFDSDIFLFISLSACIILDQDIYGILLRQLNGSSFITDKTIFC